MRSEWPEEACVLPAQCQMLGPPSETTLPSRSAAVRDTAQVLTIDSSNWEQGVSVTVVGSDDFVADADRSVTVHVTATLWLSSRTTAAATVDSKGIQGGTVQVTNVNDDTAGLVLSAVVMNYSRPAPVERGSNASLSNGTASATNGSLLPDWALVNGTGNGTWALDGPGSAAGLQVAEGKTAQLDEQGSMQAWFWVRLSSQPYGNVYVPVRPADPGEVRVKRAGYGPQARPTLFFNDQTWAVPQQVGVW